MRGCNIINKDKGITLIALVITIIVLLILAGVSIAMLTGDNGILTQAQNAKEQTELAKEEEQRELDNLESIMNEYETNIEIPQVNDENPGVLEKKEENVFVINSIEDLVFFSYDVRNGNTYEGKTVELALNLDFKSDKSYADPERTDFDKYGYNGTLKTALISGEGFKTIGTLEETKRFKGTFEGNNNVICSMYQNIKSEESVRGGLFAASYGVIKNVGTINSNININGEKSVVAAGIVGNNYGDVLNCYSTGNINITSKEWLVVGGVCGSQQKSGKVEGCYNKANITATNYGEPGSADISCGGIIAQLAKEEGNVNKCYNTGNINVDGKKTPICVGGIVGNTLTEATEGKISNCYNIGEVNASSENDAKVGSIIGMVKQPFEISNCYNIGDISAGGGTYTQVGGIIGVQIASPVKNVINMGQVIMNKEANSTTYLGGIIGREHGGKTLIENAYNLGNIDFNSTIGYKGSIIGVQDNVNEFSNCQYLKGTADKGIGNGTSPEIKEISDRNQFPSILEIVNGEDAFKEDSSNINGGYPIIK